MMKIAPTTRFLPLLALLALVGCSGGESGPKPLAAESPLPESDLWTVDLVASADGFSLGETRRLTDRAGYDNQPSWVDDDTLLFASERKGNADIYSVELADGKITRITSSEEREYSPTLLSGGESISTIRVERERDPDGNYLQRIWKFAEGAPPEVMLRWKEYRIGYHEWLGDSAVALAVVVDDDRMDLLLADIQSQRISMVPADVLVGRCLKAQPGRSADEPPMLAYVAEPRASGSAEETTLQKYELPGEGSWIRLIRMADGASRTLIQLPEGTQDFTWAPDGGLLTSDGTALLHWTLPEDPESAPADRSAWREIGRVEGPSAVQRPTVAPGGGTIAFVAPR